MWLGKRFFDLLLSGVSLLVLCPLFFAIAVWIKVDSKGPIFFRQIRVGRGGHEFRIHKFRTMRQDAEKLGLQITVGSDPRITGAGHFLRKFKIDELPQLIDVFVGTMSFVGPRPEVPKYVQFYPSDAKEQVFSVRPGITDNASIEFKDENSILAGSENPERDYIEKVLPIKIKYQLAYVKNASLFEDLKLIFWTIKEIFIRR